MRRKMPAQSSLPLHSPPRSLESTTPSRPSTNHPSTLHPPALPQSILPAVWQQHVPPDSWFWAAMSPEPLALRSPAPAPSAPAQPRRGRSSSRSLRPVLPTAACLCLGTAESSLQGQAVKGKLMKFMGWIRFTREFMKRCLESKEQVDSISFRSGLFLGCPGKNHPSASVML